MNESAKNSPLYRNVLSGLFLVLSFFSASAQDSTAILVDTPAKQSSTWVGRLIQRTISDTSAPGKTSFRNYPTLGYAPETSVEFGISSLLLFNAKHDTNNRISEISAFTFVTLNAQYGLWLDNAIYGNKDNWFFLGRTRFQRFPLLYYGIGSNSIGENPAVVDATYLLARQRVLKKIIPNLFFGPEVDVQSLFNSEFQQPEDGDPHVLPQGHHGTTNVGLGLGVVFDDRHNVLNVRKGHFGEISFLNYRPAWGSDLDFLSVNVDGRYYKPVTQRNVLAFQVVGNFTSGRVPFNQLALLGGDMIMRGYYMGRYRDNNLIAAQTEYRWLPFAFSKRFGGAVFASAGAVSPTVSDFSLNQIRLTGGGGIRYLLFPKKDIFLRFDVGVTREGVGFYIYTGEAF